LDAAGTSVSIDRILDIRFGGIAFDRTCKKKFLETARARMSELEIPGLRIKSDIGNPDALALASGLNLSSLV
jgi:hypothetical protein